MKKQPENNRTKNIGKENFDQNIFLLVENWMKG